MIRFYALRVLKDKVGHVILIGLPLVLMTIMIALNRENAPANEFDNLVIYIGLIYIIMFQGFGSAYTFEGIENDFFKPFKQRLLVSPVNPIKFIFANIIAGITTSFLQSLALILYLILFYGIRVPSIAGVLFALVLGVLFSQLLASLIILLVKKAGIAQAIITVYIIIAMMAGGFFVSFPTSDLVVFLEQFSSPLAWVRYTAYGFIDGELDVILLGSSLLISTILILLILTYKLSQKVLQ